MLRTTEKELPMTVRFDHANVAVRDLDGIVRFLSTAFPEFRVRGSGSWYGQRWVHVGNDAVYVALYERRGERREGARDLNHLGFEVDDVEAVRTRLAAAGYRDSTTPNAHPHRKRIYFEDADGNDWEFVQYTSADPAERNDYAIRDVA
jgi:catechol 2,3-dioxygenase-like lactoylglutathione lyase family enzyme